MGLRVEDDGLKATLQDRIRCYQVLLTFIKNYNFGPYKAVVSPAMLAGKHVSEGFSFVLQGNYDVPGSMEKATKFLSEFESLWKRFFVNTGKHLNIHTGNTMNSVIVTVPRAISRFEEWSMLFNERI